MNLCLGPFLIKGCGSLGGGNNYVTSCFAVIGVCAACAEERSDEGTHTCTFCSLIGAIIYTFSNCSPDLVRGPIRST
jgi:hypothetical protein